MGKGRANPDIRSPEEAAAVMLMLIGLMSIVLLGASIERKLPEDCGVVRYPAGGISHPAHSQSDLLRLTTTANCTLTPLAQHTVRNYPIPAERRPCTTAHVLEAYPAPICKRGMVGRVVLIGSTWRKGAIMPWHVTTQTLCCPLVQKRRPMCDADVNDGLGASKQHGGNEGCACA